jgi:hypothetical protein
MPGAEEHTVTCAGDHGGQDRGRHGHADPGAEVDDQHGDQAGDIAGRGEHHSTTEEDGDDEAVGDAPGEVRHPGVGGDGVFDRGGQASRARLLAAGGHIDDDSPVLDHAAGEDTVAATHRPGHRLPGPGALVDEGFTGGDDAVDRKRLPRVDHRAIARGDLDSRDSRFAAVAEHAHAALVSSDPTAQDVARLARGSGADALAGLDERHADSGGEQVARPDEQRRRGCVEHVDGDVPPGQAAHRSPRDGNGAGGDRRRGQRAHADQPCAKGYRRNRHLPPQRRVIRTVFDRLRPVDRLPLRRRGKPLDDRLHRRLDVALDGQRPCRPLPADRAHVGVRRQPRKESADEIRVARIDPQPNPARGGVHHSAAHRERLLCGRAYWLGFQRRSRRACWSGRWWNL